MSMKLSKPQLACVLAVAAAIPYTYQSKTSLSGLICNIFACLELGQFLADEAIQET